MGGGGTGDDGVTTVGGTRLQVMETRLPTTRTTQQARDLGPADKIVSLLDEHARDMLERQFHVPAAHRLSSLFWARQVGEARDECLN